MEKSQIIIVGGGLAGLTAAIHLSKLKMKVTVI
jgi:flavin-dependent dehydrogenase